MMLASRWREDQSNIEFVKEEIFDQRKESDNEDSIDFFFSVFATFNFMVFFFITQNYILI